MSSTPSLLGRASPRPDVIERTPGRRLEWADLFADARGVTPFLHPAWLLPWSEAFNVQRVCAVVVRNRSEGRLIGILPLPEAEDAPATLAPLGGGISDHRGPVLRLGQERAATRALFTWIESRHSAAVFDDLPSDHPWATDALSEGWARTAACLCPVVPLPASVDEWTRGLSHGLRRNVRRYGARLDRLGSVERLIADEQSVSEVVEAFITLDRARCANETNPDYLPARRSSVSTA